MVAYQPSPTASCLRWWHMSWLRRFGSFWYDFIVGDDWRLALAVAVGLSFTALLVHAGLPAWWVLPALVIASLTISLSRARRGRS
jgi:hypothetical protein